jgi:C-terminal processing protease CtpA/Prc
MATDWGAQITAVRNLVAERYVFPELAQRIAELVGQRQTDGAYAAIEDDEAFAAAVTTDLRSLNDDRHLGLRYHATELSQGSFDEERYRAEASLDGYGVAAVRRLDGNVGLLDLRQLTVAGQGGAALVAAMTLLATTDALLIDLRRNGGGEPGAVALICGYLFDEPTHLNDFYSRVEDKTFQSWSPPFVPGPRFGAGKPVWVLTSGKTFSGAEELANILGELGRASLVGEVTGGGANPAEWHRITAHLQARVPTGRPISTVSGGNWEGTGVQPHLEVPAAEAFDAAYRLALKHVVELGDEGPRRAVAEQAQAALG